MQIYYDREAATDYAKEWALANNPRFALQREEKPRGAAFISECLLSGSGVMNNSHLCGWYYQDAQNQSQSWCNHEKLYKFLLKNKRLGPFAREVTAENVMIGDIVQMENEKGIQHSCIITEISGSQILVCSHELHSFMQPLSSYKYDKLRFLHIIGVRN